MMNLRKNINKFYKHYDLEHIGNTITMTRADMHNQDALMTAYESLWLTMEHYDDDSAERQWMSKLYAELGDYIAGDDNRINVNNIVVTIMFTIGVFVSGMITALILEYGFMLELAGALCLPLALAILAATHFER